MQRVTLEMLRSSNTLLTLGEVKRQFVQVKQQFVLAATELQQSCNRAATELQFELAVRASKAAVRTCSNRAATELQQSLQFELAVRASTAASRGLVSRGRGLVKR